MKSVAVIRILGTLILAGSAALSTSLAAQDSRQEHKSKHHRYKLIDLGTFGGPNSGFPGSIESVNPSGVVTGAADTSVLDPDLAIQNPYFGDPYIERTYIWNDGHRTALPSLRDGGNAGPQWINKSASIVGASENGQIDPFFWDGSRMVDLGSLGGTYGFAVDLNNRGQVIGNAFLAGDVIRRAFLWPGRDGKMIKLPTLGGTRSEAKAINNAGDVTGAARLPGDTLSHPVLWTNGRVIDLGVVPGDLCAEGMAINSRRQIVGFSNHDPCFSPHAHGFLWENGVLFDLNRLISNPTTLTVIEGTFINERGDITGNAVTPEGNTHAVVLIPCDEFHPNRDGCDYRDVDESEAALSGEAGPTARSGSSALHDRHAASKKMPGLD